MGVANGEGVRPLLVTLSTAILLALASLILAAQGCAAPGEQGFAPPDAAASDDGPVVVLPSGDVYDDGDASVVSDPSDAAYQPPVWEEDASVADPPYGPTFDAGPDGLCGTAPATGDLAIVELMIEPAKGASDYAQWVEVTSARDCALDVSGLHGDCAVGAKVASFDLPDDTWLPARGSFVVVGSLDPAVNHDLPGTLVPWTGVTDDVLRTDGSTVTLTAGGVIVDSITYPTLTLSVGVSLEFPADCLPSDRSDWTRWQPARASWFPGFAGTPNAPNDDVECSNE
jgi:hypothetical protein